MFRNAFEKKMEWSKNYVQSLSFPEIQSLIEWNKKLYEKISKMALERLKFEDLDKEKRLTDKNSKWYNNKLQYALNRIILHVLSM